MFGIGLPEILIILIILLIIAVPLSFFLPNRFRLWLTESIEILFYKDRNLISKKQYIDDIKLQWIPLPYSMTVLLCFGVFMILLTFILSNINTFASTAIPMLKITPAMLAKVNVA